MIVSQGFGKCSRVNERRRSTVGLDLGNHLVGDFGVRSFTAHRAAEIVDHNRGSASRQVDGIQSTQPTSGPGDYRNVILEIDHESNLSRLHLRDAHTVATFGQRPRFPAHRRRLVQMASTAMVPGRLG